MNANALAGKCVGLQQHETICNMLGTELQLNHASADYLQQRVNNTTEIK